jgi:hypothetical protein
MNATLSNTQELFLMKLFIVVVLAVFATGLQASELPTAKPETVGFSNARLQKIS